MSIVALRYPRFLKQILNEQSRIDNFNARKLWVTKGNDVGQKHIEVWYNSLERKTKFRKKETRIRIKNTYLL
jgi:hypothetical protein